MKDIKNIKNILVICTGNTCRSPMAKGLLEKLISEKGVSDITVDSAGLAAIKGHSCSKNAALVMSELNIDLSKHETGLLNRELADYSDIILCMTNEHKQMLEKTGLATDKIYVLDVSDPFGGDIDTYRSCRDEINAALLRWISDING